MEVETNKSVVMNYEAISNEIRQLYEGVEAFKKKRMSVDCDFKAFCDYLTTLSVNHSFPTIEQEINTMIGGWDVSKPLGLLKTKLVAYWDKMTFIDQEVGTIEGLQQKLLQYPDRHNSKKVTNKVGTFLQKVNTISLSQLGKNCSVVIPNIYKMIDAVFKGFSDESKSVGKNKEVAQQLKKRIDGYSQYVDRFNLRQICDEANRVAEQIIQTPNMLNPEEDSIILQKANQQLDQCVAQFEAEQKKYDELKQLLSDNLCNIWKDDSAPLMKELKTGVFFNATPVSQLQTQYDKVVGIKEKEISQAMSDFSAEIRSFFSDEIRKLRESQRNRQNLRNLISEMNRKVEEDRERFIKKFILYLGIAIAAGILIWVIVKFVIPWVIDNWPWILLGIVVIGFIIYKIIKR